MAVPFKDLLAQACERGRPMIGGHRGARSLAPENTLPAASRAHAEGADFWELDVAMTLDEDLVVLHDTTLERTTDARDVYPGRSPWAVHAFTLAELQRLDAGSWFLAEDPYRQIAAGALTQEECLAYEGVKIPTLRQALALTRNLGWKVNVEIKDLRHTPGHGRVVSRVLDLILDMDMVDHVLVSSFHLDYLRELRARHAGIATAPLVLEKDIPRNPVAFVRGLGAQALHPPVVADLASVVPPLLQAGLAVNVWPYREPEEIPLLLSWGASGLITGFPQAMGALRGRTR